MAKQLQVRLKCIHQLLAPLPDTTRITVSKIQADAFVANAVKVRGELTTEDRATLTALAVNVPFHEEALQAVLCALSPSEVAAKSNRRAQQDYESFPNFLTADDWTVVKEGNPARVQHQLFERLRRLGLRLPKEHTVTLMSSFCIIMTTAQPELVTPQDRQSMMRMCAKDFKASVRLSHDPIVFLKRLPERPEALEPSVFNACYLNGDVPVACPSDTLQTLREFDKIYGCRGSPQKGFPMNHGMCAIGSSSLPVVMNSSDPMQMFLRAMGAAGINAFGQQITPSALQFGQRPIDRFQAADSSIGLEILNQNKGTQPGDALTRYRRVPSLEDLLMTQMQGDGPLQEGVSASQATANTHGKPTGAAAPATLSLAITDQGFNVGGQRNESQQSSASKQEAPADETHQLAKAKEPPQHAATSEGTALAKDKKKKQSVLKLMDHVLKKPRLTISDDDKASQDEIVADARVARKRVKTPAKPKAKAAVKKSRSKAAGGKGGKKTMGVSKKSPTFSHIEDRQTIEARSGVGGPGGSKCFSYTKYGGKYMAEKHAIKWCQQKAKERGVAFTKRP